MLDRLVEQRKAMNLFCVHHSNVDSLSIAELELAERLIAA